MELPRKKTNIVLFSRRNKNNLPGKDNEIAPFSRRLGKKNFQDLRCIVRGPLIRLERRHSFAGDYFPV